MMHRVLISLAANCDHEKNLSEARRRLGQVLFSSVYTQALWTDPLTPNKSPLTLHHSPFTTHHSPLTPLKYLNQLVGASTLYTIEQLQEFLKHTEQAMGRTAADRLRGIVRIDLDLLQYDDQRYHLRDWERPYVTRLLGELDIHNIV